jgi:hypothetical protein
LRILNSDSLRNNWNFATVNYAASSDLSVLPVVSRLLTIHFPEGSNQFNGRSRLMTLQRDAIPCRDKGVN